MDLRPLRERFVSVLKQLWPAYLCASFLILYGFSWGLPDSLHLFSFQADENAAVHSVQTMHFPSFDPRRYNWGTGLFYQAYLAKKIISLGGLLRTPDHRVFILGRIISYLSALGAITTTYLLGRRLFDEWTGRLAALILSVLPGFVVNSHYFKTDIPMLFWLLVAMLFAYELIASSRLGYVWALGLALGYAASIKYSAALLVPSGLVAIGMADWKLKPHAWLAFPVAVGIGFIIGEPRLFFNWRDIIAAVHWVKQLNATGQPYAIGRPPAWLDYSVNVLPLSLTLPMLALTGLAVLWAIAKGGKKLLPIWAFICPYYLLVSADNERLVRYTTPLLPFMALLVAYLIKSLREIHFVKQFALPAISIVLLYVFIFSFSYVQVMAQTDPRVQASNWIIQNIPKGGELPINKDHYTNFPDLPLLGYKRLEIDYNIEELQKAESPYLIFSEFGTRFYLEAIEHYPAHKKFFDYVNANYVDVVHFENSQRIFGIDSKATTRMAQDWLHPNPRITILRRETGAN